MRQQKEIQELATYLSSDFYGKKVEEQKTDQTYADDTFKVPWIDDPMIVRRTGVGATLIDSPASRIVTSNPVAYRDYTLQKDKDSAEKVAVVLNDWLRVLKSQQFFKGHIKTNIKRGEAWIQVAHNYGWIPGKKGMPVHFIMPDPMIVFPSPKEDEDGVPEFVIMKYERAPMLLAQIYPQWSKSISKGSADINDLKKQCKFLYYIDSKQEFAEIDGEVVRNQKNLYGFVPFIHKYSGFGDYSPNALPEEKAIGRLRFSRHTLERYTSLISDVDSSIHLFANPSITFRINDSNTSVADVAKVIQEKYKVGAGYAHIIPFGVEDKRSESALPEQAIFQYLASLLMDLKREDPMGMSELPLGSSGRQDDIVESWSLKRYGPIIENTEQACGTAFGMALKICEKSPLGLMPDGIEEKDIKDNYQCRVELKAADPLEKSARITLGGRLKAQGLLSLEKMHTDYMGMSQDESKQERARIICDAIEASAPVEDLYAMIFAEEANLEEYLDRLVASRKNPASPAAQQRIQGETQTPRGMGELDSNMQSVGARYGPEINR